MNGSRNPTPRRRRPRRRWRHPAALLAGSMAALALAAGDAPAQVPTLPRVDSLIEAGQYDQARADLDRWWSAREEFDVPGSDRARGLMLRARLAGDIGAAEPDYLAVVLGYPTSDYAPEALLRLGQGLLAAGEPVRAAGYLQRLTTDYPGRPQRTPGLLWLARANTAARRTAAACDAARDGLRAASEADLVAMLRLEEAAACAVGSADADTPAARPVAAPARGRDPEPAGQPVATPTPARPAPTPATPPESAARESAARENAARESAPSDVDVADGRYAAQAGAFRYRQGARDLMDRLEAAGYEPRTVVVPANGLLRVRVGRLASAQEAARLVARLKGQGFDAYVVGDVRTERAP